jgi:hypothetical protein
LLSGVLQKSAKPAGIYAGQASGSKGIRRRVGVVLAAGMRIYDEECDRDNIITGERRPAPLQQTSASSTGATIQPVAFDFVSRLPRTTLGCSSSRIPSWTILCRNQGPSSLFTPSTFSYRAGRIDFGSRFDPRRSLAFLD